ncbi:MAG: GumC family protein [Candidatus Binatia bacterium]
MAEHDISWQEVLGVLLRRWQLILGCFIAGVTVAAIIAWVQHPTYLATARIMVTSRRARIAMSPDANAGAPLAPVTDEDLNSEVALLKSVALVREVLTSAANLPEERPPATARQGVLLHEISTLLGSVFRLPAMVYDTLHRVPPLSPLEVSVRRTADLVAVTPVAKSNLIEVSYEDMDPQWAADFVNQLVARHVDRQAQINQQSEAQQFFETQRQLLSQRLHQAEEALRQFYGHERIAPGENRTAVSNRVAALESELAKSQTELAEGESRVEFLAKEIGKHPRNIPSMSASREGQPDALQLVRTRIIELELQRSELLSKFAPTSTKVQDLERQIAEAKSLLAAQQKDPSVAAGMVNPTYQDLELDLAKTQAQLAAVRGRVVALQSQAATLRSERDHLEQVAAAQDRLEQDVTTAKNALITYSKKEEEARFSSALDESRILNVSVVEPAQVPVAPQRWKGPRQLSAGAALSLLLGIGLAFVRDRIDPSIKSAAEACQLTGLPLLGEIPSRATRAAARKPGIAAGM